MRPQFLSLILLSVMPFIAPSASASDAPVVGASCPFIGQSELLQDNTDIIVCLAVNPGARDCASGCLWKSMTTTAPTIPSGMVAAFNLASCPTGWSVLGAAQGRMIIGVGNSGTTGSTNHTLNQTGGEEKHTLTIAEMPSHTHPSMGNSFLSWPGPGGPEQNQSGTPEDYSATYPTTGAAGGGQAHNTMAPYLALLYCQKN